MTTNERWIGDVTQTEYDALVDENKAMRARIAELAAALNRAGDRLAQVQPGVTEPWAFDIVPTAEQEIADTLRGEA